MPIEKLDQTDCFLLTVTDLRVFDKLNEVIEAVTQHDHSIRTLNVLVSRLESVPRADFENTIPQSQWTREEGLLVAARQSLQIAASNSGSQSAID